MTEPPARVHLIEIDGRYELVITEISSGATHRFDVSSPWVASLAEDAARALGRIVRSRGKSVQSFVQNAAVSASKVQSLKTAETQAGVHFSSIGPAD